MSNVPPDPSQAAPDKLRVEAAEPAAPDLEALKARIAAAVREDSSERRRLTPEQAVVALARELRLDELRALLAEMAMEERYADLQAIVAPSGRVYLFSSAHLEASAAAEMGANEEAKLAIVEKIRGDSRAIQLTPIAALEELFPLPDPAKRAALMAAIRSDERFEDIQEVAGPNGEVFYHSDRHVSGNYGAVMMRAKAKDPCWSIAELVRHNARIIPSPTFLGVFEQAVFEIDPGTLEATVEELLRKPEYADIKRLVHPKTKAVYLYSDRFLSEAVAVDVVEWNEYGSRRNP